MMIDRCFALQHVNNTQQQMDGFTSMFFTIIHKKRSAVLFTASDEIFVLVANEPNVYRGVWFRHVFRFRTFYPGHLIGTISSRRL